MSDGSLTAGFALILWIPFSAVVFYAIRPHRAILVVFMGAVMFLPEIQKYKLPVIPEFNKLTIASLCIFLGCLFRSRKRLLETTIAPYLIVLLVLFTISATGTALTNLEPLQYGPLRVQELYPWTILTLILYDTCLMLIPFFVGMQIFRNRQHAIELFTGMVVAGLIYSVFILAERRLAPILHYKVYGYQQHVMFQTIRSDGTYRPMVFMQHGLATALFMTSCAIAAAGMAKARLPFLRKKALFPAIYLSIMIVVCNSFGALIYGIIIIFFELFLSTRWHVRLSAALCVIVLLFPLMRSTDLFPMETLIEWSSAIDENRGTSLAYRYGNEKLGLEKANERPLFGWGGSGRSHVYETLMGVPLTVYDGQWILVFLDRGYMGFIPIFSLLVLPVFVAYRRINRIRNEQERILIANLSMLVAINAIDLLPNGFFYHLQYFYSGSLLGLVTGMSVKSQQ